MADFDRDGDMEPRISGAPFNSVPDRALFENRRPAGGTLYASFLYASSGGQARAAIMLAADFDVDGDPDIAWSEASGVLRWSPNERIHGRAFLSVGSDQVALPAGASPRALLAADLDGNGLPEAVVGEHAGRLLRLPRAAPAARHN